MKKLSTGEDSILKSYMRLTMLFFGAEGKAVKFLQKKIDESPNGENEEVIADERQMVYLLANINEGLASPESKLPSEK